MNLTKIKEIFSGNSKQSDVKIGGWVRAFRGNRFIELNDGSSLKNIQCVIDPEKNKKAIKFDDISFEETIKKGLKIMDTTAFTLSKENKLPIIVFDINIKGNLTKVVSGEKVGTRVFS